MLSIGCATQNIKISRSDKDIKYQEPNHSQWNHFFLMGIAQSVSINAEKICRNKNGIHIIQTQTIPVQAVIHFFTGAIYTPSTTNVYCLHR
jgi:hypothetical protein